MIPASMASLAQGASHAAPWRLHGAPSEEAVARDARLECMSEELGRLVALA